jgi:MFS family permease
VSRLNTASHGKQFLKLPHLPRFGRNTWLLISVTAIFAASFFGIQALLKVLYLLRLGHRPEYIGLFNASSAFAFTGMSLPSGILGGRFGPRRIMLFGAIVTIAGMVLLPMTEFVPPSARNIFPIVSQIVLTTGYSMLTVNMVPMMMASAAPENREQAFAVVNALRGFGSFVGTVFGGMLPRLFGDALNMPLESPGPYRLALLVGAAVALFALIPLGLVQSAESAETGKAARAGAGRFPLREVILILAFAYVGHAGWAACQAFGNAYFDADLRLSTSSIGLAVGAGQLAAVAAPLLAPRIAAGRGNRWVLLVTTLGTAVFLVPLVIVRQWAVASVARVAVMGLAAAWMPALQIFQMERVRAPWRAMAYGAVSMALGFSYGSMSLAGGYIVSAFGYRALFFVGVVASLAGVALIRGMRGRGAPQR